MKIIGYTDFPDLEERLRNTRVGKYVRDGDRISELSVRSSAEAADGKPVCHSCVFGRKPELSANECPYRESCMAHLRPDGKSVIFVRKRYLKNDWNENQ